MDFKKLKNQLEKIDFNVNYRSDSDMILIGKGSGAYWIEFVLTYEKTIKNYIPGSYSSPEEGDMIFQPLFVSDLYITMNTDFYDLDEDQYYDIVNIINKKLGIEC